MKADEIFQAALEKRTPAERAAYLEGACAHDSELRAKVKGLLQSHEEAGSFLQQPLFENMATVSQRLSESPGSVIGPYRLLEQIGEGGFGVVFMAEQTAPVKRKVALKVIKPGMDSREVIARFEAERQALALMDHPNIARVLDAGATDTGRPFFVMELVRGIPITEYCDQSQLSPKERLELFVTVCHAVQHAHQKGIIHRDIKPTNVLVTLHDDRPVVKVIDFGVAKATSGHLTDKTLFTGFAQMIGTPLYMSPEQAALSGLDIDTRSDIYSLGVLLYELLTGTTPFDKMRLQQAAFDEVRRIIREEEPAKPSTRLSELSRSGPPGRTGGRSGASGHTGPARQAGPTSLASIAALRKTEPRKLSQLVRGDLDWIVMKALEKDRARRYETANGFAADVLRYLSDEPVAACPPSAGYRFRKFARRNRGVLATVSLVAAALVAGIVGTTWQAIRATHEATRATKAEGLAEERYTAEKAAREQADAARAAESEQRQIADQQRGIAEQEKQRAEENFDKARRAVDAYLNQVTESELLSVPGLQPLREDLLQAALEFYAEFTQDRANDPTLRRELASAHYRLGRIHSELGNTDKRRAANAEAIRLYEQLRDAGHSNPDTQVALAWACFCDQRYDDTMRLCQDVLLAETGHAEARSLLADTHNALANAADDKADLGTALKHHRQAFELRESLVREAPDSPRYLAQLGGTVNNLGNLLYKQQKAEEALSMFERAAGYTQQAHEGAPHSLLWGRWFWICLGNVARTQAALGREQDALASYQRHVGVARKRAFDNPAVAALRGDQCQSLLSLARYQQQLGNTAESARSFGKARDVLENIPHETPAQLFELAGVYAGLAQPAVGAVEPSEEEAAEQQHYLALALQTLHQAVDAGFTSAPKLRADRSFDVLRERAEFQQLVASLDAAVQAQQLASRNAGTAEQTLADRQRAATLLTDIVTDQPGALRHRETLAATLHSIGVIQTGLKQFDEAEESLRKALEVWDTIRELTPSEPEAEVDRLGTRIALGSLYWSIGRFPEGHRTWQQCSLDLGKLAAAHRENTALQARIAAEERLLCGSYGRYGLWPLAGEYVRRSAEFRRVGSHYQDAEFSALLLLPENAGAADTYLAMLAETTLATDERYKWKVAHLVRTAAMARSTALTPDDLVSRARDALQIQKGAPWWKMVLAIALYRAGGSEEAFELMTPVGEFNSHAFSNPQLWYVKSIVAASVGHDSEARVSFQRGESLYKQACLATLAHPVGDSLGLPNENWHELIQVQAQRREAQRLLSGDEPPDDPWQHLIQARGYRLIGELEQADRELAAAAAVTPDGPEIWMARARLLTQWDDQERSVEADWQKAVDLAGDDPLPWIHRGRWYAERGKHEKADADFAKAASLTPHELNKFFEAGWWVVGPYPPELKEFCPPEVDPDPSRPVYVVHPLTGLSDAPVPWSHLPAGPRGEIDVSGVAAAGESAYLMAIVYSPDERTLRMDAYSEVPARIWINGRRAGDFAGTFLNHVQHLPVTLAAGRNVILAKLDRENQNATFRCQLGDAAESRLMLLAREGLWQDAAQLAVAPPCEDLRRSRDDWSYYFPLLHLDAVGPDYESHCREIYELTFDQGGHDSLRLAIALGLRANGVTDTHAAQLIRGVNEYLGASTPEKEGARYREGLMALGLLLFRIGDLDGASDALDRIELSTQTELTVPIRALIAHRRGSHEEAERWLSRAVDTAGKKVINPTSNNWSRITLMLAILLREAESTIQGATAQSDAFLQRLHEAAVQRLQARDPRTAAYDEVIYFTGGLMPEPLVARGKRLAELGRVREAEADFNKAVELAPTDPDVLAARGVFLADSGEPDKSAADFHAALSLLDQSAATPRWYWGSPIDWEVAQRDDVSERLTVLRPDDLRPLMTRMVLRMQQGDFDGMRRDGERLASFTGTHRSWAGAAALCRGDREAFDRIRETTPWNANPVQNIQMLGLAPTEEPLTTELLQQAERMWREQPQTRWYRRWLGLAQLRAAKYADAVASLEASLAPGNGWQTDGVHWPLLAMAHHHLGNTEAARRWLNQTALWLELRNAAESRHVGAATAIGDIDPASILHAMAFYLEARALIDGPDAAAAARDLLATQGREQAQTLAARADARRQGALARAEADWQRAVDLAGDDPLPLIQRGRWYAERGEQEKADADFAQAASLTPDELNKFLEAGWWVVGPYPAELKEFCPPELDPDPSVPVHVIDPQSGLSEAPERWLSVPTGRWGRVDLTSVRIDDTSLYALAYVHSPQEQTTLLMIQKTQPLRIWVNGELVEDGTPGAYPPQPHYEQFHRVPVVLRAGRNSVLIKAATADFTVRLGDTPRDRALLLAEQERFAEALAAHAAMTRSDRDDLSGATPHMLRHIVALLATDDVYLQACRSLFASAPDAWAGHRFSTAHLLALRPNALFDQHAATLIPWTDEFLAQQPGEWALAAGALVHYRAGSRERSLALLDQYPHKPHGLPLRALLSHQAGDAVAAEKFLQEALSIAVEEAARKERDRSSFHGQWHIAWWYEWATFRALLREAEQEIRSETTESDGLRERCAANASAKWAASPETVAFDQAILFGCLDDGGPKKYPQPLLARGRRLVELGRLDEAEVDFNKAVELAPDNVDVLLARARFHAMRGDFPEAERDFDAARTPANAAPAPDNFALVRRIENELGRHDDVLAHWQDRTDHSHGNWLWRVRGQRQIQLGNWQAAAEHLAQGDHWSHDYLLAPLYCLLDDAESFRKTCEAQLSRMPVEWDEAGRDYFRMEMLSLRPTTGAEAAELARLVELRLPEFPNWRFAPLGAALYRNGRYDEALRVLNDYLGGHDSLQRNARAWPLLAMTHWQLGHHDEARRWLNRTAWWLDLFRRAVAAPETTGFHDADCRDWLYTNVFFAEAKALIEHGPETEANNP